MFNCIFFIYLIVKSRYVVYVELFEGIHLNAVFSYTHEPKLRPKFPQEALNSDYYKKNN